ncbi:MAG: ABC transporter substrate-binding protein [Candidatus Rokubacteria bacterium]|nr:ABC transporter substrate-binding protein [Candidatus Rokubacteria bacterium]MBI3826956.1 ABC transporter substrate-binding protein [Candidatus Rokubacteria bacterium]
MKRISAAVALLAVVVVGGALPAQAQKKTLTIALNQDPDILDPSLARTYVGRIVFSHICEKLYEIDEQLRILPQLAADLPQISDGGKTVTIKLRPNVKFNDGSPMDAEAVRFSLDRHRTLKGSNRASELAPVDAVEVVDKATVRLRLKAPFAPLLAQLTDRAGMPVSPAAVHKLGDKFGTAPVCVGPWQFAERVPQDRIVVERSPHYFDPGSAKFDKVIFRIIPDDNVRLANLKSGDIDLMHQVGPTDAVALKKEPKFEVSNVTGLGYQGITINLRNKTGKQNPPGDVGTPLANDPRVREAFELSIDREALNQVAWDGLYTPGCTPIPPISVFFDKSRKCPPRDIAKAKQLLAAAGLPSGYAFEMVIVNNPRERRVGEVIQQMAKEAGFNISLRPSEFASALKDDDDGKTQTFLIGWSGRVDPDGNIHQIQTCKGSLNSTLACDDRIDALLNKAREVTDVNQRRALYREATDMFAARRNVIYVYHQNYIVAFPKSFKGYTAVPDGLIRAKGTSWP